MPNHEPSESTPSRAVVRLPFEPSELIEYGVVGDLTEGPGSRGSPTDTISPYNS
jgi:hypothetical protein